MKTDADPAVFEAIVKACERFERIAADLGLAIPNRITRLMDLLVCHGNGCPLQLDELVIVATDRDFVHDVAGITRHMDRTTGRLGDGFTPRFVRRDGSQA